MVAAVVIRLAEFCRRAALPVVIAAVLLTGLCAAYSARHFAIDTNADSLISNDIPYRQRELDFERAFPQTTGLLVVVVDGDTADVSDDAAAALAGRLGERTDLFRSVRRPDAREFFRHNGLLFLPVDELQSTADRLIEAQPMIGSLAVDPSLRGLFSAINLALEGVARGEADISRLDRAFGLLAAAVESSLAGTPRPLSWQTFLTGRAPRPQELRRSVLVQPKLDFAELASGSKATEAVRQAATELNLTPENGVRVRLTGPVALNDEEFTSVAAGIGVASLLTVLLIGLILFLALGSVRLILAIALTLAAGLAATTTFALAAVGTLNLISVAFAVLFVGIGVDFGIQFAVRYREERYHAKDHAAALRRAAAGISAPLLLAAATTAAGFFSFLPTAYAGVSELGLIAGAGMIIAVLLSLSLLPALLTLLKPGGETASVGYRWTAGMDRFLLRRRRRVLLAALGLGALGQYLQFDFNPLNLKNQETESMATLNDLMRDPATTPYVIHFLQPSLEEAAGLADKIEPLPEVSRVLTLASFVPEQQEKKLAIIDDLSQFLGPTLSPPEIAPPPRPEEVLSVLRETVERLRTAAPEDAAAKRLADALDQVVRRGPDSVPPLAESLLARLAGRLDGLRLALEAEPVSLDTLPADLVGDWIAADGRAKVEVVPSGNSRDNQTLVRFVQAVRRVAPEISGPPAAIQESAQTIVRAFMTAGIAALFAITLLLLLVLRRIQDVLLVLAPLALASVLTVATCVLVGLQINFANVIALPLLLGIGVSFAIYFVMNWRAGRADPLQSGTARAVLFSALTTVTAFGSLALSAHPGTASMGALLTIALGYTLVAVFVVLPALLGPPPEGAKPVPDGSDR